MDKDTLIAKLLLAVGHDIEIVTYGEPPVNVSVEDTTTNTVILDFDLERSENG